MGYIPNYSARLMKANVKQLNIAFFSSFETPMIMVNQWLLAIDASLTNYRSPDIKFQIIFEPYHSGKLKEYINTVQAHAAIITNTTIEDDEYLMNSSFPFPIVLIGRDLPGYSEVLIDQEDAGKKAASLLIDSGCKKIALMVPEIQKQVIKRRITGFKDQLGLVEGIQLVEIPYSELSEESGFEAVNKYLKKGGNFDGIFALYDILAVGIYHALYQNNKRIPDDVSVVGFEGVSYAPFLTPPLTTFNIHHGWYYREAMELLLKVVFGEIKTDVTKYFKVDLALRSSTKQKI